MAPVPCADKDTFELAFSLAGKRKDFRKVPYWPRAALGMQTQVAHMPNEYRAARSTGRQTGILKQVLSCLHAFLAPLLKARQGRHLDKLGSLAQPAWGSSPGIRL